MAQAVLLLDTGCGPCSTIGRQITAEGLLDESPVELGSLHDDHLRTQVQAVRPDAKWEPTLLRRDDGSTTIYTGLRLAVELTAILGIRRAYRISQLVRELAQDDVADPSRRTFLVKFASAAAAVPILGVGGLALSTSKAKAGDPLTSEEVETAYSTVLRSRKFKRLRQSARRAGLRHRRYYSEAVESERAGIFKADTYGGFLAGEDDTARLVNLMLTYTDSSGQQSTDRFITAIVDSSRNRVVSIVDVDGSDIEPGTVTTRSDSRSWAYDGTPALSGQVPAGVMRFSNGDSAIKIDEGVVSGNPSGSRNPIHAKAPTPGPTCTLVCALVGMVVCLHYCWLWFLLGGLLGGVLCELICNTVFIVTCWMADC